MGFGRMQDVWVGGGSTKWDLAGGRICGWEDRSQNGIWREAGCVGGRREHRMGFGGRQNEWVGAQNGIWREAGHGGCKKGAQNGIWWEAYKGFGSRMRAGMGEGKRVDEHRRQNVSLGGP
jgi:hypothetical protein